MLPWREEPKPPRDTAKAGFMSARALSTTGYARPFDVDRDGFVMGEGAAVMVLEAEEVARDRGAEPVARVLGGASTADRAHHVTAPHPSPETGAERSPSSSPSPTPVSSRARWPTSTPTDTGTELNDRTGGSAPKGAAERSVSSPASAGEVPRRGEGGRGAKRFFPRTAGEVPRRGEGGRGAKRRPSETLSRGKVRDGSPSETAPLPGSAGTPPVTTGGETWKTPTA
jgi:hypothetical protein